MIATGPLAAKRKATIAAAPYEAPKSAAMRRGRGKGKAIFSSGMRGRILG
jgi:hypothetical protein